MELDNGQYVMRGMSCMGRSLFIMANFFVPLHATLTATSPGVYYLGHVDATVRERVGNEFRAGAPIPLLDQAVAGAASGTFDVAINKALLPAFDRDVAQKWWEAH